MKSAKFLLRNGILVFICSVCFENGVVIEPMQTISPFLFACACFHLQEAKELLLTAAQSVESGNAAHRLWQLCSSLSNQMTHSAECPPLKPVIDQLRSETGSDPLFSAAMNVIPPSVLEGGLQTERVLKQRFPAVRRGCQRVAMVPDDGQHGFWTYAMSYARSLVTFPRRNLSLDSIDLSTVETCDLLALGEQKLQEGDLEQAVRILNQLRGQPRVLAQDWLDQARLLLETRQALDVIVSQLLIVGHSAS